MELLIPGLILVALMVYASTRIKKTAAAAFEPETIEDERFVIQKPRDFLHVIGGDPKYAFEAYSKELGTGNAENLRGATAKLRIDENRSIDHILSDRLAKDAHIIDDTTEVIDDIKYRVIEAEWTEDDLELYGVRKLAEHDGRVYDLEARMLKETTGELRTGIETFVDSFRVK